MWLASTFDLPLRETQEQCSFTRQRFLECPVSTLRKDEGCVEGKFGIRVSLDQLEL